MLYLLTHFAIIYLRVKRDTKPKGEKKMERTLESVIEAIESRLEVAGFDESECLQKLQDLYMDEEEAILTEKRIYHLANEAGLFELEIEELIDLADTKI
jgi:hypothetical protein